MSRSKFQYQFQYQYQYQHNEYKQTSSRKHILISYKRKDQSNCKYQEQGLKTGLSKVVSTTFKDITVGVALILSASSAIAAQVNAPILLGDTSKPEFPTIARVAINDIESCGDSCELDRETQSRTKSDGNSSYDDSTADSEQEYTIITEQELNDDNPIDDSTVDLQASEIKLRPDLVPLNAISPKTIATFVEVVDIIRQDYIKPVNDEALFITAIQGMLEKLDVHAEYLTPKSYEKLRGFTDGEIGQVGLKVKYDRRTRKWLINQMLPRSSAKEANIKLGDELLRIKKVELNDAFRDQDIDQLLSGIAGSQVQVTIKNKQGKTQDIILQRNLAQTNKLNLKVINGIAVVQLPVFQNNSKTQLINALREKGVPVTGIVIDIRNNPGGVLASAVDIVSLFIEDEDLIQVRNRENKDQTITAQGTPILSDLPLVIIQNKYTASAAEVLASSLQTNNRALIIGETSYGKGTVQEVVPLQSGGGLKLTVAEYRSATGDEIDGVGIHPDIPLVSKGSEWIDQAVELVLAEDRPIGIKFDNSKIPYGSSNDY